MKTHELIAECRTRGIVLEVVGARLRCRAPMGVLTPELKQALADQKATLVQLLAAETPAAPPAAMTVDPPCPRCGASAWRDTPDAGRWCVPCVMAGRDPVAAVKVHSAVLDTEIWVVCDDLPREAWPTDAPVYTQEELKILRQVGPDTRAWVHATKTMFDAQVVDGGRRPAPNPLPLGEAPEQE